MPLNGTTLFFVEGVDPEAECSIGGPGLEDGWVTVHSVIGPYTSGGITRCGALLFDNGMYLGERLQVLLYQGENYLDAEVHGSHFRFASLEEVFDSDLIYYFGEDAHVAEAQGYAGSVLRVDVERYGLAYLTSVGVDEDGDCSLSGEGVDEYYVEMIATVGPYEEDSRILCGILVYTTENAWAYDEFDVMIEDGTEDNTLNVKITVVDYISEDYDEEAEDFDDDEDW